MNRARSEDRGWRARSLLVALSASCAAAGGDPPSPPPNAVATEIDLRPVPAVSAPTHTSRPVATAPAADERLSPVGDSGVGIFEPPGSSATYDDEQGGGYGLVIGSDRVEVTIMDEPAPASLQAAARLFPRDSSKHTESGRAPNGVLFEVGCFDVRVGVPSPIPGQHIHRLQEVCRVWAILPVGSSKSAQCVGYFERPAESDPAALALLRRVCSSMAVMTKR